MINEFKKNVKDLVENKIYLFTIILIAVGAFGFAITHFAIGIDDFGINHYMNLSPSVTGNMLQQGRLLHIVFYYITGLVDVIPFLNNFIGVVLLVGSAIFLVALVETVRPNTFNTFEKIIFSALFLTNSIISFKFIYDLDVVVVMFSYACVPLAVIYGLEFYKTKRRRDFFTSFIFVICSIASYESFNAVYICLVLFVLILYTLNNDAGFKEVFKIGCNFLLILVTAFITYYVLVKLLCVVTGNPSYARSNFMVQNMSLLASIKAVIKALLTPKLFFAIEFVFFAVVSFFLAIYYSIKTKKAFMFLLFMFLGIFTLIIPVWQGILFFRTCQVFNLFIACIALLTMNILKDVKVAKSVLTLFMVLLVVWQVRDMNLWFYKDWSNYEKNQFALNKIATDLNSGYDVSAKAVCFINRDYDSYLMSLDENQYEIGESPIVSAIGFLGVETSPELIQLFRYQQYSFIIQPTSEQIDKARGNSADMPAYPKNGYIKELEDIIVVKLGE